MKRCPKCEETKGAEAFGRSRRSPDGLQCWCRGCKKAAWLANRDAATAKKRADYRAERAIIEADPVLLGAERKRAREYQKGYIAQRTARDPAYALTLRRRGLESFRRRNAADPTLAAAAAERSALWRKNHPGFQEALREYFRAATKRWRSNPANRVKLRAVNHRRRARLASVPSSTDAAALAAILSAALGRCAYCAREVERLTFDHIVPIARGGHDVPENLAAACVSCNSSKGAKDPFEWAAKKFGDAGVARVLALGLKRVA